MPEPIVLEGERATGIPETLYELEILSRSPRVVTFLSEQLRHWMSETKQDESLLALYQLDEREGTLNGDASPNGDAATSGERPDKR